MYHHALLPALLLWSASVACLPALQVPLLRAQYGEGVQLLGNNVTEELFYELEELARIVDISYCVGSTGIQEPFLCASRCQDFEGFQLVTTWNTGPLLADSCGYIVISHPPSSPRIIVAFRGTYSVANTIIDLSTVPQEYVPYPEDGETEASPRSFAGRIFGSRKALRAPGGMNGRKCDDCYVHAGFMLSWKNTRAEILPHLEKAVKLYPGYQLTLVGHSLGGAVAALASLDFQSRGWNPKVTTFGEPRLGNRGLVDYIDSAFPSENGTESSRKFRRVTHVDDPVPLLPLKEWGYTMHAGEVYISKSNLSPDVADLHHCIGDEDPDCIEGTAAPKVESADEDTRHWQPNSNMTETSDSSRAAMVIPSRFKLWQLFFAHRDYFWRLGLCIPGGDPLDWYRKYPRPDNDAL